MPRSWRSSFIGRLQGTPPSLAAENTRRLRRSPTYGVLVARALTRAASPNPSFAEAQSVCARNYQHLAKCKAQKMSPLEAARTLLSPQGGL